MSSPGEDIAKEIASTATKTLLGPVAEVGRDIVMGTFGDRISVWRKSKPAWEERNRIETLARTRELLAERGVDEISDSARPEQIEELLDAAADAGAAEIRELFARLLAAAVDPTRQASYRSDFVSLIKQFEPIDALLLNVLSTNDIEGKPWKLRASQIMGRSEDELVLAAKNLHRLDFIEPQPNQRIENNALVTARGRRLRALIA